MQPAPTQQSKNDIDSSAPEQPPDAREQLHNARARAAQTGILAFKDDLQQMRESVDLANLNQTQTSRGESSAQALKRSIVTSSATGYSGGITTDSHSIDTGGPALAARQTTRVQGRPTGDAGKSSTTGAARAAQPGGRSDEAIRRVMDENKGAIFAIYNRALRRDPLLEGKLVFEMLINPDGSVSDIQLLSSELQDTTLTGKLLGRIRMINFGAADVSATRVNYSFDFLPYT
jgi:outer membrane biosynthesis protein TonB